VNRLLRALGAALLSWTLIVSTAGAQQPRWEVFATCAAAYRANWQNRLTDPTRAPSMSSMIKDEAEHYGVTAAGYYEKDRGASRAEAAEKVAAFVEANVSRLIAMDKAGTLEAFIDMCPQIEEQN
jgi:hypothetical protein